MYSIGFPQCDMRAPHRADGDGAARTAVDLKRLRKTVAFNTANVVQITGRWIAAEINQVNRTRLVYSSLRLNASIRCPKNGDFRAFLGGLGKRGCARSSVVTCSDLLSKERCRNRHD